MASLELSSATLVYGWKNTAKPGPHMPWNRSTLMVQEARNTNYDYVYTIKPKELSTMC